MNKELKQENKISRTNQPKEKIEWTQEDALHILLSELFSHRGEAIIHQSSRVELDSSLWHQMYIDRVMRVLPTSKRNRTPTGPQLL